MAENRLEKLRAHTQDLDSVVREEIRRTLVEELDELTAESRRAAQALKGMKRAAHLRGLIFSVSTVVLSVAIPSALASGCCLPPRRSRRCGRDGMSCRRASRVSNRAAAASIGGTAASERGSAFASSAARLLTATKPTISSSRAIESWTGLSRSSIKVPHPPLPSRPSSPPSRSASSSSCAC